MGNLEDHTSSGIVKVLSIGDSKTGKTGSLVSLVKAGYSLRILDTDNLLSILKYMILKECPDKIRNVDSISLRDKRKAGPTGPMIVGQPKAFSQTLKLVDEWKYKDAVGNDVNLGRPDDWGPDTILVLDSLSRLCDAAYDYYETIAPRGKSGDYDARAVYRASQKGVESLLAHISSDSFNCNVIVICHVAYYEQPDGTTKGMPQGIGQKLSPKVAQYFPSVILYTNKGGKRTIQTNSTPLIDLANPKPFEMAKEYPIDTGLASFFEVLRPAPSQEVAKPKAVTLKRV